MRDRAYRYHQNKTHNDRTACRGHFSIKWKKTVRRRKRPHAPSEGMNWKNADRRSIEKLQQQIEENNGTPHQHVNNSRQFPNYYN